MSAIEVTADEAGKTLLLFDGMDQKFTLKRIRYNPAKEQKIAIRQEELAGIAAQFPQWLASLSNADAPNVGASTNSPPADRESSELGNSPSSSDRGSA